MAFAAEVAWLSTRPADTLRSGALVVSIADAAWVLATIGVLAAGVLMIALPMVVFFIFAQRYIIGGVTAGAVKG